MFPSRYTFGYINPFINVGNSEMGVEVEENDGRVVINGLNNNNNNESHNADTIIALLFNI